MLLFAIRGLFEIDRFTVGRDVGHSFRKRCDALTHDLPIYMRACRLVVREGEGFVRCSMYGEQEDIQKSRVKVAWPEQEPEPDNVKGQNRLPPRERDEVNVLPSPVHEPPGCVIALHQFYFFSSLSAISLSKWSPLASQYIRDLSFIVSSHLIIQLNCLRILRYLVSLKTLCNFAG